jgi:choline dehydrogenase
MRHATGVQRFDALVLGGGPAGCVVGARLSENGDRTVALVEAGPDYGPYVEGRWPPDLLDARALALSHSWETDREDRSQLRARVLGGCSAHNACVVLRGAPADYDEWGPGWTNAELEPYLERAERELDVRRFTEAELSPWHRAFAQAEGAIVHPVNARGTVRWNAAFAYLDPARDRPNLTILADTLVDRVEPGRRRVLTDRGPLEAETIVLCAGAYGSAGILLRSDISPGSGLPAGENLIDHAGVGLGWEPTEELQRETAPFAGERPVFMAQVTVAARSSACPDELSDLFVFPALDPGYEISAAVFAMKPYSRGSVRLNGRDPRTPLAIDHGWLRDPRDLDVIVEGVQATRELAARESTRRYAARELRPGPSADLEAYVREAVRGFFHPVGTCAIGSVVDAGGRVIGYDGLYVADASIMPTIPRANTHLSTLAVAERIAELLG